MSAAVADYAPAKNATKLKKGEPKKTLTLESTPDILSDSAAFMRKDALRVGFAAETEDLLKNARGKLERKGLDLIVANLVGPGHDPFGASDNRVTLVTPDGHEELPLLSKDSLGALLADRLHDLAVRKRGG